MGGEVAGDAQPVAPPWSGAPNPPPGRSLSVPFPSHRRRLSLMLNWSGPVNWPHRRLHCCSGHQLGPCHWSFLDFNFRRVRPRPSIFLAPIAPVSSRRDSLSACPFALWLWSLPRSLVVRPRPDCPSHGRVHKPGSGTGIRAFVDMLMPCGYKPPGELRGLLGTIRAKGARGGLRGPRSKIRHGRRQGLLGGAGTSGGPAQSPGRLNPPQIGHCVRFRTIHGTDFYIRRLTWKALLEAIS